MIHRRLSGFEKFLEIKFKNNKSTTRKQRIKIDNKKLNIDLLKSFIESKTPYEFNYLKYSLQNKFTRITLVNKLLNERVTIDYDLEFFTKTGSIIFPQLVIIEQKKSRDHNKTRLTEILQEERIFPNGFSKYCIGIIYSNPGIKSNRFKPKIRLMKKMKIDASQIVNTELD